ncbi:DUF4870 domain-containing protein [Endozoicomonas sp. SM1973]|uniref:DUF4870 domain-containing protein n=1 Tax=Spartinivicinus marinus TaxID=2994442 RepID=A0A853I2B2_9GAMM|nr:DUF4870 domain-containing protein [Spartinivicinus marinus]MCX4026906.1 DUF4870 domain-containing protein [Spartinivicinus marinus]NYZ66749.1 DUF4870 domain-containing protein [Spartinivicinus marinus]
MSDSSPTTETSARTTTNVNTSTDESSAKSTATLVYALQAAAFILGITFIVAVVINYVKKEDVQGTLAESHFRWQIRTFWFSVLWTVIGFITTIFIIGYLLLVANGIWTIYRIVKGWIHLNDGKPMYS